MPFARDATTTPGRWRRVRSFGFEIRLFATFSLTLVLVGLVQVHLATAQMRTRVLDEGTDDLTTMVAHMRLQAIRESSAGEETPLGEVAEILELISGRPGGIGASLIATDGHRIVWRGPGEPPAKPSGISAEVGQVLSTEASLARFEANGGVSYWLPLDIPGGPHVVLVEESALRLTAAAAQLRASGGRRLLIAFGFGLPLLYVLGGFALGARHRRALARSSTDSLTQLGNHRSYQEEVRAAVGDARRTGAPLNLAVVDLDEFKLTNDRAGHRAGDDLLVRVAAHLGLGRPTDRAFRVGGDEFAVLLPDTDADGARAATDRLRELVERECSPVTLSVGLAQLADDDDTDALWERADAALYEAKRRGRNTVVAYDELEDGACVASGAKVAALRSVIGDADLGVAFQPIWDLTSSRVLGYEALARPAASAGFAGPQEAFDLADRVGLTADLDAACRAAILRSTDLLPDDVLLFVNLSPAALGHASLAGDALVRAVVAAGLSPSRVVIEVTERAVVPRSVLVREMGRFRAAGFKLVLDDVGAGNAGLEVLRHLPVDFVKVDREVVSEALGDGHARAVLMAIVTFARETGAYVIAEGIETEDMLSFVSRLDARADVAAALIRGAQGYLLGRPGPLPQRSEVPAAYGGLPATHPGLPATHSGLPAAHPALPAGVV